jgi:hypothetical protein
MYGAVAAGMLQSNNDPSQVTANCPTNNCTWSPYTTLAFCSSVEDVSSKLSLDCTQDSQSCNFTIQDSTLTENPNGYPNLYLDLALGEVINFRLFTNPSVYNATSHGLVAEMYLLFQRNLTLNYPSFDGPNPNSTTLGFTVLKGSVNLCLQTFQSISLNGTIQTNLVSTQGDLTWNLGALNALSDYSVWIFVNGTNYTSTDRSIANLGIFMQSYLDLRASIQEPFLKSVGGISPFTIENNWYTDAAYYLAVDVYGQNLIVYDYEYALNGFKARMNNLTVSMTNTYVT